MTSNICKISFLNKDVELINVSHIFHDPSAKACLPIDRKFDDAIFVYSLTNPVRSKIFDFIKFASNLGAKVFLRDNILLPCNCAASSFTDKDNRHRVIGGLRIVGNKKLRKLFTKDRKYRENNNI